MKKIVILLICLLLLVGCKNDKIEENATKNEGEPVKVKTNDGNWAKVNETYIDSLNNTEIIDAYSISVPDWKRESTDESIVYGLGTKAFIAILYKNDVYSNDYINKYNKSNNKKITINSFNVEYEDGNVYYFGQDYRYVSYYINSDITLKIIGIAEERNIKELNETVKAMVDSLMKDYITE